MGFNNTIIICSISAPPCITFNSCVQNVNPSMKNGALFSPNREAMLSSFGVSFSGCSFKKQHSSVLGAVMMNCSVSLPDGNLCFQ